MIRRVAGLEAGYELLERREWVAARDFFQAAAARERAPEALEGLGLAGWLASDEATVFEAREAAYELFRKSGDALGAARMAIWLAVDSFTFRGQIAVGNGWLQRARTFLEPVDEAPEHGWLALTEAEKTLISDNDGDRAHELAEQALRVARRSGDTSLEAYALAVAGVAEVTTGRIQSGMSKLDEAATGCIGGDVTEPWVTSSILCYMMDACDRVRDWDRAREWFAEAGRLAQQWNDREFYAQCRPHYAVVLTWRGNWADAEVQLQRSIDDLIEVRKPMVVEGIVRLAELRWRQGRLDEAATLFEQVKQEPLAQLGQAMLALDRTDTAQALEFVERCLRRLPANDRLERLPALDLYIRACLACGDCDRAQGALPELEEIARRVGTRPALAALHLARGLVAAADGDLQQSRGELEDAIDLFEASGAPFETGRARLELARVLSDLGRTSDAASQADRALAAFTALGATREAERARRMASTTQTHVSPDARLAGLTPREMEVLRLLAEGHSNQEIAEQLVLSIRTVQRHVDNIYGKIGARGRAAAGVFAASHKLV